MSAPAARPARHVLERAAALSLRRAVFCDEQGVAIDDELDGRDDEALHLVITEDGEVIATCRLLVEGDALRFGRMAVTPAARGRGLAAALLAEADARARAAGLARIILSARLGVQALYARAGYVAQGDPYDDAGIPHITMVKRLGSQGGH